MLNSNELINKVKNYNKFLNPEKLDKAYNFAVKAHKSQKRASGDPYSVHPIEVANILTDLKLERYPILENYPITLQACANINLVYEIQHLNVHFQ